MIVIFGISTLKFAEMQKIVQNKKKKKNFRTKNVLFGYFRLKVEKVLSYFQHPRICQNAMFLAKLKILNFGSKNV